MDEAAKLIHKLVTDKFFGSLILKFESGQLVLLRKEETIKPQHCLNKRGITSEHDSNS